MARQRLIKPEFFQHEELHRADTVSALPCRLAFIGLWTQADRRGLFAWKPSQLKLNVLPFDECDFSKVLDTLEAHGFIESYEVEGKRYGRIPTFANHQSFNKKEYVNKNLPEPTQKPVRARRKHRVGTEETLDEHVSDMTSTGIGRGIGTGIGIKDKGVARARVTPEWVTECQAQWSEKVGHLTPGRVQKALGVAVESLGWEAVQKGLADYLTATPLAKARLEWFAERATYWAGLAAQPLTDPGTGQPTARYRVVVEGKAA